MTLLDLIAALRLRLDDQGGATGTIPTGYSYYWEADDAGCLWKNAELTDAINQAQVDFCQRNPIMDPTPTITLVAGTASYDTPESALTVERVLLASTGAALQKISHEEFDDGRYPLTGTPRWYYEDTTQTQLIVVPTPLVVDTLRLTIQRLPETVMTWAHRTSDSPEIAAVNHPDLLDYAEYLCFLKRDADTDNLNRAMLALSRFDARVGDRPSAKLWDFQRRVANKRTRSRAQFM
jgi:hypothetical protein